MRRTLDPARQRALEERILRATRKLRVSTYDRLHRRLRVAVLAGFAAGAAATLVTMHLLSRETVHPLRPSAMDAWKALLVEERGLFADRRPAMARVFTETERLFGPNLRWIAQSEHTMELGVSDTAAPGTPLMVRITLVARHHGSTSWQRIWGTEVVARTDDLLELPPPGTPHGALAVWMHPLGGCAALVENRLALRSPVGMEAESSEVLRFGATRSVRQFRHAGIEYRLLQTVAPIGGGACSS